MCRLRAVASSEATDFKIVLRETPRSQPGALLLSHIRQKTLGATSLANTHPFDRGRWVFAHNGTIMDVEWLIALEGPRPHA